MEIPSWLINGVIAVDAESTGCDVEQDRIVSAAVLHLDCRGVVESRTEWLVNPGIEIPDTATGIHGISTAQARRHGRPPAQALTEIAEELHEASDHDLPVVVFNAPFDLTLLDRELRRHVGGGPTAPARVLDPLLLERAFSDRRGRRRLRAPRHRAHAGPCRRAGCPGRRTAAVASGRLLSRAGSNAASRSAGRATDLVPDLEQRAPRLAVPAGLRRGSPTASWLLADGAVHQHEPRGCAAGSRAAGRMSMPTFVELEQLSQHPEPNYPEYTEVREAARAEFGPFVSPKELDELTAVIHSRCDDWYAAVLGKPVANPFRVPVAEARMLIIADRRDLNPPLPQRIQRWRTEDAKRRAAEQQRRDQLAEAAWQRWAEALAQCAVEVEVRPNTRGGRREWRHDGPLRHVVALTDARSGRSRHHPAGRALCETPRRAKPLQLGEPVAHPATCRRCLEHATRIRPAETK